MNDKNAEAIAASDKTAQPQGRQHAVAVAKNPALATPTVVGHLTMPDGRVLAQVSTLVCKRGVKVPLQLAIANGLTKVRSTFIQLDEGEEASFPVGKKFPGFTIQYSEVPGRKRPAILRDEDGNVTRVGLLSDGSQFSTELALVPEGTPDQRLSDAAWLPLNVAAAMNADLYLPELPGQTEQ